MAIVLDKSKIESHSKATTSLLNKVRKPSEAKFYFGMVKAPDSSTLIVAAQKVGDELLSAFKKINGNKGEFVKGRCYFGEDDKGPKVIFAVTKGSPGAALDTALRKAAQELGVKIRPETRPPTEAELREEAEKERAAEQDPEAAEVETYFQPPVAPKTVTPENLAAESDLRARLALPESDRRAISNQEAAVLRVKDKLDEATAITQKTAAVAQKIQVIKKKEQETLALERERDLLTKQIAALESKATESSWAITRLIWGESTDKAEAKKQLPQLQAKLKRLDKQVGRSRGGLRKAKAEAGALPDAAAVEKKLLAANLVGAKFTEMTALRELEVAKLQRSLHAGQARKVKTALQAKLAPQLVQGKQLADKHLEGAMNQLAGAQEELDLLNKMVKGQIDPDAAAKERALELAQAMLRLKAAEKTLQDGEEGDADEAQLDELRDHVAFCKEGVETATQTRASLQKAVERMTKPKFDLPGKMRALEEALPDQKAAALAKVQDARLRVLAEFKHNVREAQIAAAKSQKLYDEVQGRFEKALTADPEAKALQDTLGESEAVESRAAEREVMAQLQLEGAQTNTRIAAFVKEALEAGESDKAIFARFEKLTSDMFDDIIEGEARTDPEFGTAIQMLSYARNDDGSIKTTPQGKPVTDPNYADEERKARQVFVKLVERDEVLQKMGASLEDRQKAFAGVPRVLWPRKLKEELQSYALVAGALAEEETENEETEAAKKTIVGVLKEKLGDTYELVSPLLGVFFDGAEGLGDILDLEDGHPTKETLELIGAIGDALEAVKDSGDEAEEAEEGREKAKADPVLAENQKRVAVAKAIKAKLAQRLGQGKFAIDSAPKLLQKLTGEIDVAGVLGKDGAERLAGGVETAGSAIESFCNTLDLVEATGEAAMSLKGAYDEWDLGDEEDPMLDKALKMQSSRRAKHAVKQTAVAAGKVADMAEQGLVAKGLDYGAAIIWQGLDWSEAARAQKTMQAAQAGSERAMQQVFADHQRFATMYIAMKAKEGNNACLKMCVARGLNGGKVLDAGTSHAVIRQALQKAVEQEDDDGKTFTQTLAEKWDLLCKIGRLSAPTEPMSTPTATTPTAGGGKDPGSDTGITRSPLPSPSALEIQARTAMELVRKGKLEITREDVFYSGMIVETVTGWSAALATLRLQQPEPTQMAEALTTLGWTDAAAFENKLELLQRLLPALPQKVTKVELTTESSEASKGIDQYRKLTGKD